ncbi:MAG: after-VIT domain-containing protein, partial [Cyanobacteria bacterium P01_H01_bin.130]
PDLFAAQPLVLFGRKKDLRPGTLVITGTQAGGKVYEQRFQLTFDQLGEGAIAQLWARSRIKDLMNQLYGNEVKSLVDEVTNTALAYRLLSQYTAFVAVSQEVRVDPDGTRRSVEVPVELPEGVSYEGIFGTEQDGFTFAAPGGPPRRARTPAGGNRGLIQPSALPPPVVRPGPVTGDRSEEIAQEPLPDCDRTRPDISVIKADGLTPDQTESLEQYLCSIAGFSGSGSAGETGDVFLEVEVRKGRLVRIVVDDLQSTVSDRQTLNQLRRLLRGWWIPDMPTTTQLKLHLRL